MVSSLNLSQSVLICLLAFIGASCFSDFFFEIMLLRRDGKIMGHFKRGGDLPGVNDTNALK